MSNVKQLNKSRALVLFSGGQDSTTCLAYALDQYDYVETIGFDYGQRNAVELTCRLKVLDELKQSFPNWATKLGQDCILDMSTFSNLSSSALTDNNQEITVGETGLPTTFVPGRNLFFFHYAAVIGYNQDLGDVGWWHVRNRLFWLPRLSARNIAAPKPNVEFRHGNRF